MSSSEETLLVGKKGEIYTSEALRSAARIRKGGKVKARVVEGRVVLEPLPTLEEVIGRAVVSVRAAEAERLSERAQKEAGAYG